MTTPTTTPLIEKREPSAITGSDSQEIVATRGPPASAATPAIISEVPTQAANMRYSGFEIRGMNRSARPKKMPVGIRNSGGPQPVHGVMARIATARIANDWRLSGRMRPSMSSMRSRSKSSRQSHELRLALAPTG